MSENESYLELFIRTSLDKINTVEQDLQSVKAQGAETVIRLEHARDEIADLRSAVSKLKVWQQDAAPSVKRADVAEAYAAKRRKDLVFEAAKWGMLLLLGAIAAKLFGKPGG